METANPPKEDRKRHATAAANQPQPLTQDGERPQKKFYRQRAHCNPLSHNDSFSYPIRPENMDWTVDHYPHYQQTNKSSSSNHHHCQPTILDVGCGFGGLTMALGDLYAASNETESKSNNDSNATSDTSSSSPPIFPKAFVLGLEIRAKVTEYVRLRIAAARSHHNTHHHVSVLRTNAQKFLPHLVRPHSLEKLFFCFADPHFKRKNHARRIISDRLLTEYAHFLQYNIGKLYAITDVYELHCWQVQKCEAHPLFQRVVVVNDNDKNKNDHYTDDDDPCIAAMVTQTEEGQKVDRNGGQKYFMVYRRISWEQEQALQATAVDHFWDRPAMPFKMQEKDDDRNDDDKP